MKTRIRAGSGKYALWCFGKKASIRDNLLKDIVEINDEHLKSTYTKEVLAGLREKKRIRVGSAMHTTYLYLCRDRINKR